LIQSPQFLKMDAVVQLIRNGFCCVKDLTLFPTSFIHDASYTTQFYRMQEPMDKTTPLEVIIFFAQLYACISTTRSGWRLITTSIGKVHRIDRLLTKRLEDPKTTTATPEDRIVNTSLLKEAKFALRSILVGCCVTPIGICFIWLSANSLHVSETDWIGGVPALIHALEVAELFMLPLLYYMIVDGLEQFKKSQRTKKLLETIESGKLSEKDMTTQTFEAMTGWVPFWDSGVALLETADPEEDKKMSQEVRKVKDKLSTFLAAKNKKGEKEDKIRTQTLEDVAEKLEADVSTIRMEGYREFIYFVLNLIAWYGYFMAPLCFYWEDHSAPYYVRILKFSYENETADWHGNFAGDLMWTIEPILILGSPILLSSVRPKSKKVKAD
jgi:hypothetical protein